MLATAVQVLAAAVAAAPAPAVAAAPEPLSVGTHGKFRQMLGAVGVDEKALKAMNGILLVPSDAGVAEFAGSMGGLDNLLSNKHLVDQVTAYHYLPGISVKQDFKAPNFPLITKTGVWRLV